MKRANRILCGMAFAVAIVFSMTAATCGSGGGGSGGLTITGIPSEYNGKYVFLTGGDNLMCYASAKGDAISDVVSDWALSRISNGKVTTSVWDLSKADSSTGKVPQYTGSSTFNLNMLILDQDTLKGGAFSALGAHLVFAAGEELKGVTFKNGKATAVSKSPNSQYKQYKR